jgi:hypothetical protein
MAKKFLNRPRVSTVIHEMRGKRMTQSMWVCAARNFGTLTRFVEKARAIAAA